MTGQRAGSDAGTSWAAAWSDLDGWPGRMPPWGPAAAWAADDWRADAAGSALRQALHAVESALARIGGAEAADWDSPTAAGQYREAWAQVRVEVRGMQARLELAAAAIAVHEGALRLAEDARRHGYAAQIVCGAS